MGAEKRLQRKLNRMGKKKGNSVDVNDGEVEVTEFIQDHGTKGQKRRATRLYDKINKSKGITMVSPLDVGRCWKNYKPNPDGRPASEKGSCVPI